MSDATVTTLRSNGERSARGYASAPVPAPSFEPRAEAERVILALSSAPLPRSGRGGRGVRAAGPRNPHQLTPHPPKAPPVELPDGRPLTKTQHFWIDPDQLAAWDAEEEARRRQVP